MKRKIEILQSKVSPNPDEIIVRAPESLVEAYSEWVRKEINWETSSENIHGLKFDDDEQSLQEFIDGEVLRNFGDQRITFVVDVKPKRVRLNVDFIEYVRKLGDGDLAEGMDKIMMIVLSGGEKNGIK